MHTYLRNLENRLTDDQKDMLRRIYAPTVVETPLSDARRDICILPSGEIRSYGDLYVNRHEGDGGVKAYLSSMDAGLSWTLHYAHGKMNSCTYIEKGGVYLTACGINQGCGPLSGGLCVMRSEIGPDDPDPEMIVLSEEAYKDAFLPTQSAFTNRVWFTTDTMAEGRPAFFYSDDFGKTWTKRELPIPHYFETTFPHKSLRWCRGSGTEPQAIELSENKMMMIIRTPMDCFYKSYSFDGGETWTEPEPSIFYGTDTTAFMLRLTDGRVMTFWNNTRPLSQPNIRALTPYPGDSVLNGTCENAFTNRDAAHVAISEDGGETYIGFREFLLNEVRSNSDFRYVGGAASGADKSVHQHQAFELPYGKILVCSGQNVAARRLVIFDINWLYETARKEDFMCGVSNVTTHTYTKSVSGCYVRQLGNGHCAWNRTYSAYPMPDPEGTGAEALLVSKHHDDRLINDISGVTWNFPSSRQGRVTVELKITEKQARFVLTDRWYNTCDPYAVSLSPFWFELDVSDTGSEFTKVVIDYDADAGYAMVSVGGEPFFKVKMTQPVDTGISYLILQCAADGESEGFFVRSMEKV